MGGRCIEHKWVGGTCDWCGMKEECRIKRYSPYIPSNPYFNSQYPDMEEDAMGEYVKLEDVEEMMQENEDLHDADRKNTDLILKLMGQNALLNSFLEMGRSDI